MTFNIILRGLYICTFIVLFVRPDIDMGLRRPRRSKIPHKYTLSQMYMGASTFVSQKHHFKLFAVISFNIFYKLRPCTRAKAKSVLHSKALSAPRRTERRSLSIPDNLGSFFFDYRKNFISIIESFKLVMCMWVSNLDLCCFGLHYWNPC